MCLDHTQSHTFSSCNARTHTHPECYLTSYALLFVLLPSHHGAYPSSVPRIHPPGIDLRSRAGLDIYIQPSSFVAASDLSSLEPSFGSIEVETVLFNIEGLSTTTQADASFHTRRKLLCFSSSATFFCTHDCWRSYTH